MCFLRYRNKEKSDRINHHPGRYPAVGVFLSSTRQALSRNNKFPACLGVPQRCLFVQPMATTLTTIGLSGGIATGKSTCCRILRQLEPRTVIFDADDCVRHLYGNSAVIADLERHFGNEMYGPDGTVDKSFLRARAFSCPADKLFLEQVFHPKVREECLALLKKTLKNNASRLFVADIPLLFESGFDFGQSANFLVATSRNTQIDRLKRRNNWNDETVEAVLSSQIPIDAKLSLADVVFWNEGSEVVLEDQCRRFLRSLAA